MDPKELESLLHDVEELKRAVRRNNPFLREVLSTRFYPALGLVFGLLVVLFCGAAQVLIGKYGSVALVPEGWKLAAWLALGAYTFIGGAIKWIYLARRARDVDRDAGYMTVIRAIYSGSWLHLSLPAAMCMFLVPVAALISGHPWYIVPGSAIFFAFLSNSFGLMVQRSEYLATGWYTLATSLLSLYFLESKPLLWLALIWGGGLCLFGLVGLITHGRRSPS